jgi:hypothetical protein
MLQSVFVMVLHAVTLSLASQTCNAAAAAAAADGDDDYAQQQGHRQSPGTKSSQTSQGHAHINPT